MPTKEKPYRNKYDLQSDKKKNPERYYETNEKPSQTIQGQSMSIKELFKRHREGQLIKERKYQYLDVESIQNLEEFKYRRPDLDFTDLQKLVQQNKQRQQMLEKQLEISKKIQAQAEKEMQKDLDGDGKIANPKNEAEDGIN